MRVPFRLNVLLPGVVLFAVPPFALAESPLPDPIPPAVIGRPLDQIGPDRTVREKRAAKPRASVPSRSAKAVRPAAAPTPAVARGTAATPHGAKQALDDRADPSVRIDDVGKGTHFARKRLGPGAYFADRHRVAVRKYYEQHPLAGGAVQWQIGEPVPRGAALAPVPQGLLASLPRLPPGHRYVQLGGEVVLIAAGSKMVVDGISRTPR